MTRNDPPAESEDPGELQATLDSFFPLQLDTDEPDADICRDITLLSALSEDCRPGRSTVLEAKQTQAGGSDSTSDLWSHISFALTPGSSNGTHDNEVVAVVGRVEPESIVATVVSPSTSQGSNNGQVSIEVDGVALLEQKAVGHMFQEMVDNPATLL